MKAKRAAREAKRAAREAKYAAMKAKIEAKRAAIRERMQRAEVVRKSYREKYARFLEANPTMKDLAHLDEEKKAMTGKQMPVIG